MLQSSLRRCHVLPSPNALRTVVAKDRVPLGAGAFTHSLDCACCYLHDLQFELTQVPSPLALVIGGAWSGHLAGGSLQCETWPSNPQFIMSTQQKSFLMLSIMRTASADGDAPEADQRNAIGMAIVEVRYVCASAHRAID